MTRKLTLSINEKTIEKARRISRRRGKSISRMVEEYLDNIAEKENQKESLVKKSSGALKEKIPADIEWKKTKADYLKKKYGV
jgi:Family of unknown function (DUF6364)